MKLYRQKEQLKKDILKKRIVLEKELQIEIQKEVETELTNRAKHEKPEPQKPLKDEETADALASPSKKRYITHFIVSFLFQIFKYDRLKLK